MMLQGNIIDYFVAFGAGVFLSFSPCIYALVPVTASFITVSAGSSKTRGFFLSSIYVLGLAITYSTLGLIASLTGRFFGQIARHPLSLMFVGALFIFFGLNLLDVFSLPPIAARLSTRLRQRGTFSVFLLGLVSGLAVTPCVTPVLGSILTYVSTRQNVLYGITLLFTFAYGLGFLLILVGTFSAILVSLPRANRWMSWVTKIGALLLIGLGVYFLIQAGGMLL